MIGDDTVYLDTKINYQAIQLDFVNDIKYTSLLPSNYLITKGNQKIIIAKLIINDTIEENLFKYRGTAYIVRCILVDNEFKKHNIRIITSRQTWEALKGNSRNEKMDWAYMTINWEDLNKDGNNNKRKYWDIRKSYDSDNKKITITREIKEK